MHVAEAAGLEPGHSRVVKQTRAKIHDEANESAQKKKRRSMHGGDMEEPMPLPFMAEIYPMNRMPMSGMPMSGMPMTPTDMCDGTLIGSRFVLTSALCVLQMDTSLAMGGIGGMTGLEVFIVDEYHDVVQVHLHPLFLNTRNLVDYNVAVLEL
eukprot:478162-Rhodomonas_salina.1